MSSTGSYGLGLNDCNMITEVRNRKVPLTSSLTCTHITHMHITHTCTYAQHMHSMHMPSMHMHRTCLTCMHAPDHNTARQCTLKPYDMVVALDDVPHLC